MKIYKEFKEFALRGNVVDMAVGVIIGSAFGKIVSSFVTDLVMPPLGVITGGVDFGQKKLVLKHAVHDLKGQVIEPAITLNYGTFLDVVLNFIIVAFCIFMAIKVMNALRKTEPVAPNTKECPRCLGIIPLKATRCGHCTSDLK